MNITLFQIYDIVSTLQTLWNKLALETNKTKTKVSTGS